MPSSAETILHNCYALVTCTYLKWIHKTSVTCIQETVIFQLLFIVSLLDQTCHFTCICITYRLYLFALVNIEIRIGRCLYPYKKKRYETYHMLLISLECQNLTLNPLLWCWCGLWFCRYVIWFLVNHNVTYLSLLSLPASRGQHYRRPRNRPRCRRRSASPRPPCSEVSVLR